MAKRYDEPIEVTTDERETGSAVAQDGGVPFAFSWRGRNYYVDERLSSWREAGQWWEKAEGHYEREYFRVVAHRAGAATGELDADGFLITASSVYDIYRDRLDGTWRMGRVWD